MKYISENRSQQCQISIQYKRKEMHIQVHVFIARIEETNKERMFAGVTYFSQDYMLQLAQITERK